MTCLLTKLMRAEMPWNLPHTARPQFHVVQIVSLKDSIRDFCFRENESKIATTRSDDNMLHCICETLNQDILLPVCLVDAIENLMIYDLSFS